MVAVDTLGAVSAPVKKTITVTDGVAPVARITAPANRAKLILNPKKKKRRRLTVLGRATDPSANRQGRGRAVRHPARGEEAAAQEGPVPLLLGPAVGQEGLQQGDLAAHHRRRRRVDAAHAQGAPGPARHLRGARPGDRRRRKPVQRVHRQGPVARAVHRQVSYDPDSFRTQSRKSWGAVAAGWGRNATRQLRRGDAGVVVDARRGAAAARAPGARARRRARATSGSWRYELIQPGGELITSDFSPEMLTVAQERARGARAWRACASSRSTWSRSTSTRRRSTPSCAAGAYVHGRPRRGAARVPAGAASPAAGSCWPRGRSASATPGPRSSTTLIGERAAVPPAPEGTPGQFALARPGLLAGAARGGGLRRRDRGRARWTGSSTTRTSTSGGRARWTCRASAQLIDGAAGGRAGRGCARRCASRLAPTRAPTGCWQLPAVHWVAAATA